MTLPTLTPQRLLLLGLLGIAAISRKVLLLNEELLLSVCVFAFAVFAVAYGGQSIHETLETRQQSIRKAFQQGILQQQDSLHKLRELLQRRLEAPGRLGEVRQAFLANFESMQESQQITEEHVQRARVGQLLTNGVRPQVDTERELAFVTLASLGSNFQKNPDLQKKAMETALNDLRVACKRAS